MSESQAEIDRHNRRELWKDVENHLAVAAEAVEQACASLDDLGAEERARLLDEVVVRLDAERLAVGRESEL